MKNNINLKLSIITPVLNGSKYIEECILSTVNQNENTEHVIVDGGSTDGTVEIIKKLKNKFPDKIQIILTEDTKKGSGPGEAWNIGLKRATGDVFGWLGSDDYYPQKSISKVLNYFKKNPSHMFLYGRCDYVDINGKVIFNFPFRKFSMHNLINNWNFISWPSSFYRRKVIEKVGPLDRYGNDLDYTIRIAKQFEIYYTDDLFSYFRIHNESETGNLKKYIEVCKKDVIVSKKHGGKFFNRYKFKYYQALLKNYLPTFLFNIISKVMKKTFKNDKYFLS